VLGEAAAATDILASLPKIAVADTNAQITGHEGNAAAHYWGAWRTAGVRAPFAASEAKRIPERWATFGGRKSLHNHDTTQSNRHATDPVNAMLNLGYDRGEALCIAACHAVGISPVFGMSHKRNDRRNQEAGTVRQSMALDLLEVIRPEIDAIILGLLARPSSLKFRDFLQLKGNDRNGVTRVQSAAIKREIWAGVRELEPLVMHWARKVRALLEMGEALSVTPETLTLARECAERARLALAA
jgi:CRISPR/Cas system-associated endonuclease Cas1